jgi:hypothetical protein
VTLGQPGTMEPPDFEALPRAYQIGLRLRELGADDALIGDCLGIDPAGVATLIEIGRRKLGSERRFQSPHTAPPHWDAGPSPAGG